MDLRVTGGGKCAAGRALQIEDASSFVHQSANGADLPPLDLAGVLPDLHLQLGDGPEQRTSVTFQNSHQALNISAAGLIPPFRILVDCLAGGVSDGGEVFGHPVKNNGRIVFVTHQSSPSIGAPEGACVNNTEPTEGAAKPSGAAAPPAASPDAPTTKVPRLREFVVNRNGSRRCRIRSHKVRFEPGHVVFIAIGVDGKEHIVDARLNAQVKDLQEVEQ